MASCGAGVDTVCASLREDGESAPLFVRPRDGNDSLDFLMTWIGNNKEWIDGKLLEHGSACHGFSHAEN